MRKTDIKLNNTNISQTPQKLLPKGANPWEDPNFVDAYKQVAEVVNSIPYTPQVKQAIKNIKPIAIATAAVLKAVKEHKPSNQALNLIQNYQNSVIKQTEKYLKQNLRFSSGDQEIEFERIAQKLSPKLLLGIPTPSQISTANVGWYDFYNDLLTLLEQVNENPQDQSRLAKLAASALALTEGVHKLGNQETPSPFSKIYTHPTTDIEGSPSFLPSAETLAQTARILESHGAEAVKEAINRAREKTVEDVEKVIQALSSMLARNQDNQNDQKLDEIANTIIDHLRTIKERYKIEVPGIDLESELTRETRAKATRPLEELLRAFSSIKEIERFRQRRTDNESRLRFRPRELREQTPERQTSRERIEAEEEFHSTYSMYAVGGTKPPRSYELHSLAEAERLPEGLRKQFFEEQMNQYYMGVMKMIATIAGIAARYWADKNLREELNRPQSIAAETNQNQIITPIVTAAGSTSVRVNTRGIVNTQRGREITAKGYVPIGLPLGLSIAQPQLPSTFAEGRVVPAATITLGTKRLEVLTQAPPDQGPKITGINPQQAVEHAIPLSTRDGQTLLAPIIEITHKENNTTEVRASLKEITAPTISEEQIQTIKEQISDLVDLMIERHRQRGYIPERLMRTFEMAKALQNSPNAEFHSALLRIEEEALQNGEIIRKPILNVTFILPENELRLMQEAARIRVQSNELREAGIRIEDSDVDLIEVPEENRTQGSQARPTYILSIGTYKRGQVLQPTYEEAQGNQPRQTAADRLVAVSFELKPRNYGEPTTENVSPQDLDPIEKIVLDIYDQFKQKIEQGQFISSQQEPTEFVKTVGPGESLKDAVKEATKYLDFQIARKILTTMQEKDVAIHLPQARNAPPEEFERITQQSALLTEQKGPITFSARPIVKVDNRTRNVGLELLILGYARTTPYILKIRGANNQTQLISDITDAYLGIFEQSADGRKSYSGTIAFRHQLDLVNVSGQTIAQLAEGTIQKVFAPDAGLPSGIVTIVGSADNIITQANDRIALAPEDTIPEQRNDAEDTSNDNLEGGAGIIGLIDSDELAHSLISESGEDRSDARPGVGTNEGREPQNKIPTERPQTASKPPDDANITRIENLELDLTDSDANEPKVKIFIVADGGTTENQRRDGTLKPTGTGTIVIGIIKDEQRGKKKVKVYRINHNLGNKSTLTNNKAEAFALLTGATLAREMIEALKEKGIIQDKNKVEIWMMSDSQLMVTQMSGWADINNPTLEALVKRTLGTIKDHAGTIKIAHHSKSPGNTLGRLIHEVDELSRIPRGDRGGGSYQRINIETELEQALNEFARKAVIQSTREPAGGKVAEIKSRRNLNLENITAIERIEPLTIVRITDLLPQEDANAPGEIFDLDISDFVNDFRQTVDSTDQGIEPSMAPPSTPLPTQANEQTDQLRPTTETPEIQIETAGRIFNKVFGSIKKLGEDQNQQREWQQIYEDLISKTNTTLKHIAQGNRRISKQSLMLIAGGRRAEHRTALDEIVGELEGKQVYASEVVSAQLPDLIGNTPNKIKVYAATQVGQLQARPQAAQSAIDPDQPFVSFHGRRDASVEELIQSFETGRKIAQAGGVLVVGGAVGADFAAALGALSEGGKVIIVHFRDFKTNEYGYPAYTRQALTSIYNNQGQQYQQNNFMRDVVSRLTNQSRNATIITQTFSKLANKLATVMSLMAVAPNHPLVKELLREINAQIPPTASVAFYTLRVVERDQRGNASAARSPEIRDKFLAAISDLTIEGPNRGPNSGTDKAAAFARNIAQQAPDEKAVITMQELLALDTQAIRATLEELNNARKRNLEAYKQNQQS
jgi:ribonuclease HI